MYSKGKTALLHSDLKLFILQTVRPNNSPLDQLLPARRVGRTERLPLSAHMVGGPPPFWPREGDVTMPYHRSIAVGYRGATASWDRWFQLSGREPQPLHLDWRPVSWMSFPLPPTLLALAAWIPEHGGDVVRLRL